MYEPVKVTDAIGFAAMTVLTSFCARLYGRRAAKRKTDAALKAARDA